MKEQMNQELEFDIGEEEKEATVEMNDDGTDAELAVEEAPAVEVSKQGAKAEKEDLENYSGKVKKRIDKLTARLRETQRREEAALSYAKNVQQQNQELETRFQQTDGQRLQEAQGRISSHAIALKQVIKKAREEGDIDTETEAQQRLTATMMEQQRVQDSTARRGQAPAPAPVQPRTQAQACACASCSRTGYQSGGVGRKQRVVWSKHCYDTRRSGHSCGPSPEGRV